MKENVSVFAAILMIKINVLKRQKDGIQELVSVNVFKGRKNAQQDLSSVTIHAGASFLKG